VVSKTALIAAASSFTGSGFLLPSRNSEMFRWCLDHGLRMQCQARLPDGFLLNAPPFTDDVSLAQFSGS